MKKSTNKVYNALLPLTGIDCTVTGLLAVTGTHCRVTADQNANKSIFLGHSVFFCVSAELVFLAPSKLKLRLALFSLPFVSVAAASHKYNTKWIRR